MVARADVSSCAAGNPAWRRRLIGAFVAAFGVAVCAAALPDAPQTPSPAPTPAGASTTAGAGQANLRGPRPVPTWDGLVLWSVALAETPSAPPAADKTRLYAPLRSGTVVALDHALGTRVWSVRRTVSATPVIVDGLLVGADGSTVWALDAATGSERWTRTLEGQVSLPPGEGPGSVALVTDQPALVLLAADTGALRWTAPLGSPSTAEVVVLDGTVYAGLDDGRVVAFDAANGAVRWTRTIPGRVLSLTALPDRVLAGGTADFYYSLSPKNGSVQWQWRVGGDVNSPAATDEKRIYFVAMDNMIRAIDRRGGNLAWQRPLASRPVGGPFLLGEFIILAHVAPELRCFDALTGLPACVVGLPGRALHRPFLPTLGTDAMPRLVYLSGGGQVVAVGPSPEPPRVKWTTVPGTVVPAEVEPVSPLPRRTKAHWPEPDLIPLDYAPGRLLPDEWDPVAPLPVRGRRAWPEPDLIRWTTIPGRILPPEVLPAARPPAR